MTPGLLTASEGQLLQPPTPLPWETEVYSSSREHWSHTCPCAGLLVVPDAEGEARTCSRMACWLLGVTAVKAHRLG